MTTPVSVTGVPLLSVDANVQVSATSWLLSLPDGALPAGMLRALALADPVPAVVHAANATPSPREGSITNAQARTARFPWPRPPVDRGARERELERRALTRVRRVARQPDRHRDVLARPFVDLQVPGERAHEQVASPRNRGAASPMLGETEVTMMEPGAGAGW